MSMAGSNPLDRLAALQACFTRHQLNHFDWTEGNEDCRAGKPQMRARLEDRLAGRAGGGGPGPCPRPGAMT